MGKCTWAHTGSSTHTSVHVQNSTCDSSGPLCSHAKLHLQKWRELEWRESLWSSMKFHSHKWSFTCSHKRSCMPTACTNGAMRVCMCLPLTSPTHPAVGCQSGKLGPAGLLWKQLGRYCVFQDSLFMFPWFFLTIHGCEHQARFPKEKQVLLWRSLSNASLFRNSCKEQFALDSPSSMLGAEKDLLNHRMSIPEFFGTHLLYSTSNGCITLSN